MIHLTLREYTKKGGQSSGSYPVDFIEVPEAVYINPYTNECMVVVAEVPESWYMPYCIYNVTKQCFIGSQGMESKTLWNDRYNVIYFLELPQARGFLETWILSP